MTRSRPEAERPGRPEGMRWPAGARAALRGRALLPALALFILAACGPSVATKRTLNTFIASKNYAGAEEHLQKVKESQYAKKNAVLYYLDLGTLQHHAGKFKDSDASFEKAENRMRELYTKSATKAVGSMMINDMTTDYAGEAFERALTHVFRGLNYVFLNDIEEALVESRKVEVFLEQLNRGRERKSVYKDDAFARYLDALLYDEAGKHDDARISFEAAEKAYSWYSSDYNTPKPDFNLPYAWDLDDAPEMGEIVFIHYAGVGPMKVSKTFQVAWNDAMLAVNSNEMKDDSERNSAQFQNALRAGITGKAVTVSYPEYTQDQFTIVQSDIRVKDQTSDTLLMEDVSAIAFKDLKDRQAAIRTKSIARAMIKYMIAQTINKEVEKKKGAGSWEAILTKVATGVASAATEVADTRGWSTVPSQIRMARMAVKPGTYAVEARFKAGTGLVVATETFENVVVKKGRRVFLGSRTACEPQCAPVSGLRK
ncbi:MAG: hypothetical protein HZB91_07545 [Elusimicrobia bacterium]|nr:hypothetical protein [Elusimicrobiota bacterium]